MKYFEISRNQGISTLSSWIFVFWFTLIGFIIAQFILGLPIGIIAIFTDPDFADYAIKSQSAEVSQLVKLLSNTAKFSTLIAIVLVLIHLSSKEPTRRKFLPFSLSFVTLSIVSLLSFLPFVSDAETNTMVARLMKNNPAIYGLFLLTFPLGLISLYFGQKLFHKRTILSLHTAYNRFRWFRLIQSVVITWSIFAVLAALLHFTGVKPLTLTFDASRFFIYAAISLLFIPLQSATEEIVFRGYLNQAFENILCNKWIAFVITSLMFMALHLSNPEALSGAEAGILPIVMSGYFFFGFACCLMVWMDDGLESAIGVHAANNTFAAVFINYENSVLPTPSVFQIKTLPVLDSVLTIVTLSLVLIALWYFRPRSAFQKA
jgi:membrane protease YdiL (CAAX protease family)